MVFHNSVDISFTPSFIILSALEEKSSQQNQYTALLLIEYENKL